MDDVLAFLRDILQSDPELEKLARREEYALHAQLSRARRGRCLSDDEIVDEILREYRRREILRELLDAAGMGEVRGHA